MCLTCHGPRSANGPHTATLQQHTHHQPDSAGSQCIGCHMPPIATQLADVNVRSHTFKFISPATTDSLKVPNPCTTCHTDKTTKWALDALKIVARVLALARREVDKNDEATEPQRSRT